MTSRPYPPGSARLEAEHDDGGALPARGEHRLERLGPDQRRIGVEDDDVAFEPGKRRRGLQHCVAGAVLLLLYDDADVLVDRPACGGYGLPAMTGDEYDPIRIEARAL